MYEISTNSKRKLKFRNPFKSSYRKISKNWPLIAALVVNILVYIATVIHPPLIGYLALNYSTEISQISWYAFNFTHDGLIHVVLNMLCLFIYGEEIRHRYFIKPWVQWFLYFGTAAFIGPIVYLLSVNSVVGYSGVIMAILMFAILDKMKSYKIMALYLLIYHIILLIIPLNVSILAHLVGAAVGAAFWLSLNVNRKWHTYNYNRKRGSVKYNNWREKHSKL